MMWDFWSGIEELLVAPLHLNDLKPLESLKSAQCLVYVQRQNHFPTPGVSKLIGEEKMHGFGG